uniref:Uncharacterized protein n=1 Tax=Anguilla anguilla TaxID=7936 RepID=A0A0E9RCG0_ANGAN
MVRPFGRVSSLLGCKWVTDQVVFLVPVQEGMLQFLQVYLKHYKLHGLLDGSSCHGTVQMCVWPARSDTKSGSCHIKI